MFEFMGEIIFISYDLYRLRSIENILVKENKKFPGGRGVVRIMDYLQNPSLGCATGGDYTLNLS